MSISIGRLCGENGRNEGPVYPPCGVLSVRCTVRCSGIVNDNGMEVVGMYNVVMVPRKISIIVPLSQDTCQPYNVGLTSYLTEVRSVPP